MDLGFVRDIILEFVMFELVKNLRSCKYGTASASTAGEFFLDFLVLGLVPFKKKLEKSW